MIPSAWMVRALGVSGCELIGYIVILKAGLYIE